MLPTIWSRRSLAVRGESVKEVLDLRVLLYRLPDEQGNLEDHRRLLAEVHQDPPLHQSLGASGRLSNAAIERWQSLLAIASTVTKRATRLIRRERLPDVEVDGWRNEQTLQESRGL